MDKARLVLLDLVHGFGRDRTLLVEVRKDERSHETECAEQYEATQQ